jgi:8-oxo-dGTP pyrophosphatase MutT (NUDIX family)
VIRTRLLATAFFINGDRLLLMRRSPNMRLLPGKWAPIGGHHMYFGSTSKESVGRTEEGELCWVQLDRALDLDVSATTRFTLEHYTRLGLQTDCVYVGTVDVYNGKPVISWAVLRDWE